MAFPARPWRGEVAFLTAEQIAAAADIGGVSIPTALIMAYEAAAADGTPIGTAYFDTHRVRTLAQTIMVVVSPGGEVRRVEVLSFLEPEEYLPRELWYHLFDDRPLNRDLAVRRAICPVGGATLTVRATTEAVCRVLAIHQVLARDGR